MRYEDAIAKLYALQTRGVRMGVSRMRDALRYRKVDVNAMPYVIVAGTNGKGSVSALMAAALQAAGYRTGLFTSPHLHRFTERVRIDGRSLSLRETAKRASELLDAFSKTGAPEVTFFELSTLLAVEAFRDHGCDIAVMEVGLGGRLDATNALPAVLSVITRIAFDHMNYLGHTLAEIAREKAGVIKPRAPVIVGSREPEALRVIRARARRLKSPLQCIDQEFRTVTTTHDAFDVQFSRAKLGPFKLALPGDHQRDNAACSVAAVRALGALGFPVDAAALRRAMRRTRWPLRLEHIPGTPAWLFDAAHNPDGCEALARYLCSLPREPTTKFKSHARRVLLFGAMADKDYNAMLNTLAPHVDRIVYAPAMLPRSATAVQLRRVQPGTTTRDLSQAMHRAKQLAGSHGLIIVAGSIFVAAPIRASLLNLPSDPLIRM